MYQENFQSGRNARQTTGSRYAQGSARRTSSGQYAQANARRTSGSRYADKNSGAGRRKPQRRRGKRRSQRQLLGICLVVFLVLLIVCGVGTVLLYRSSHGQQEIPAVTVSLETLDSPYAVLLDADTGEVLAGKRADEKIFPASMVKIMTVLTAIENIKNLDETVTMAYDYYEDLYARDASRAGFEPGEEAVIRDLLYGAILPSGAECCMELAMQAAGSEAAFVDLMNQKASSLGLTQTQFTNCTGLHSDSQFSTVKEIGLILREALKNKTFRSVITTRSYTVRATDVHPDGFTFESTMFKNMESAEVPGGEILGGKTGYTDEAGHCLASFAEVDGREYILVTAGWSASPRTEQYHISDAFLAYNQIAPQE